ncbi:hypothetical protein [Paraburkholderia fynbosensis]|uniref:hypothetical protein n=1 Tax=Paraburkholderia fynbosensis TaxID=1200993 RepID=UPI00158181C1|nr:hypothetical protein [Paraburkholderia fynbosensis]
MDLLLACQRFGAFGQRFIMRRRASIANHHAPTCRDTLDVDLFENILPPVAQGNTAPAGTLDATSSEPDRR